MKTIYSISQEVNNNGCYNSDKIFQMPELANKYLRKLAAKIILRLRKGGFKIQFVNVYEFDKNDASFPVVIEIGGFNLEKCWMRYDLRVKSSILFDSEDEFNNFPIQI